MKLPIQPNNDIVNNIYEALAKKANTEPSRKYLGMSSIGHPCERYLWLGYHGASQAPIDGKLARIFENGHHREQIIIKDLELAGYKISNSQAEFEDFNGEFRGHCDGLIDGVTRDRHVLEIKTANQAAFQGFEKQGIKFKPIYYAQIQLYIHYAGLKRGLFIVENKNSQALYTERVYPDPELVDTLKIKAKRIIEAKDCPPKIECSECYWCNFKHFGCLEPPKTQEKNCLTCTHFRPIIDSGARGRDINDALNVIMRAANTDQSCHILLQEALTLRPDINIPMEIYHQGFKAIHKWLNAAFRLAPAKNDWCGHPSHKAIVYQPIGCSDRDDKTVPF